jgi:hypothetical protein
VAAAQIGQLESWTVEKGNASGKIWPVITSADPRIWNAKELLQCRRDYWGIEGVFHQRLDATLDEDRSRTRTPRGLTVFGHVPSPGRKLGHGLASLPSPAKRRNPFAISRSNFGKITNAVLSISPLPSTQRLGMPDRRTVPRSPGRIICIAIVNERSRIEEVKDPARVGSWRRCAEIVFE